MFILNLLNLIFYKILLLLIMIHTIKLNHQITLYSLQILLKYFQIYFICLNLLIFLHIFICFKNYQILDLDH